MVPKKFISMSTLRDLFAFFVRQFSILARTHTNVYVVRMSLVLDKNRLDGALSSSVELIV